MRKVLALQNIRRGELVRCAHYYIKCFINRLPYSIYDFYLSDAYVCVLDIEGIFSKDLFSFILSVSAKMLSV